MLSLKKLSESRQREREQKMNLKSAFHTNVVNSSSTPYETTCNPR